MSRTIRVVFSVFAHTALSMSPGLAATPKVSKADVPLRVSVGSPLLGYAVLSSPLELRPILGTAQGGGLGDAMVLPDGVIAIALAPGQRYALVQSGDQGQIGVAALAQNGLGAVAAISSALTKPDSIYFSPSGSSAILYSNVLQRLQVLSGLPDAPGVSLDVNTSQFGAALTAAAVSDDAAVVFAGWSTGAGGFLARLASDGSLQTIFSGGTISGIRLFPHSHDGAVTDSQLNQLTMLTADSSGGYAARVLVAESQGVSAPLDLEFSTDRSSVYLANSGANNILVVDIATGSSQALTCGFPAASFQRLMTSAIGIAGINSRSVWVTDTDAAAPWVAFVPSLR